MTVGRIDLREPARPIARQQRLPAVRWIVGIVLFASALGMLFSDSPIAVLACGAALVAIILLLWRPNDLPIFLLPVIFQWSQVAVKPLLTIVYDRPIDRVLDFGFHLQTGTEAAAVFGFAGVTSLAFGVWLGSGRASLYSERALRLEAQTWNGGLMLRLTLGAIVLGRAATALASLSGSAYQIVVVFSGIEFVGLFAFAYWCFANRTGYRYLFAIMTFEILSGLTGFFADFRLPLVVLAAAALAARPTFRLSSIAFMASLAAVIVLLATFWSEIKTDYRRFVTEGSGGQVVMQSLDARLGYIYDAAAGFDTAQFADGFNKLLSRHSYIDFLGATMNYVPSMVPHEDGRLVGMAFMNMLMPRILFPDKPPLPDDTQITSEYTGIDFYSAQDTSISIGYLGELYIDFGYVGALIAAAVIGAALGFGYRILRDYDRVPRLISYGVCTLLALSFMDFGTALIKSINGAVLAFGAAFIIQRFIAPRGLSMLLKYRRPQVPASTVQRR